MKELLLHWVFTLTKLHVHTCSCTHTRTRARAHAHTHARLYYTYVYSQKTGWGMVGCCVILSHSAQQPDREGSSDHTGWRWQQGRVQGICIHLHRHTHAGVSTRLEHVPAACMLVCMCDHACCYLCAARWRGIHGKVRARDSGVCGKGERSWNCLGLFWE